ncbi:hypothetical protein PGT21_028773 [Puccinia graminis f. sp. tritici]|uniref:Uncharacterized protein n=3 Tax=Puccinia graminis f. sp. tritici TaxID=56615 RepID=E3K399_PUCGT|nr:uncharacterized protein PGTG_04912 [Puccinia graminis f. sp. tritici CRL 75-36-700-3]EFP78956.1 hypothetical protein PGTG_04912 [Puccinia graminis f. sp. tritici CRL 75-36-700-3]KAA1069589.1 hypothetical protein PGT21_028773 [Puccinia graminis f. sp. tritici]
MFGEEDSESPRRPSPWLPSPGKSNLSVCATPDDGPSQAEPKLPNWPDELEPELDELGHIEYKLKILSPTPSRFEKLKTQLKWRLLEGGGTALYELGVLDDGTLVGLSRTEMDESLANLARMARELDCELELLRVVEIPEIIVNTGPSSRPATKLPPSLRFPGGTDRKEKAKQKKKKKKSRAKPAMGLNSGIARPPTGKLRIEPGDAVVSSPSEPSSPREQPAPQEKPAIVVTSPRHSSRGSAHSLRTLLDGLHLHPRRPPANSNFIDQICLLTPEERSVIRRARRNERRAAQAAETRRSKARAEPAEATPESNADDHKTRFPDLLDQDFGGWKRGAEDQGGIKYVVEVCVAKEATAQEERFLDFEGFGISDSS